MTVTQCFSSVLAAWTVGLNLSDHACCYYVCVREVKKYLKIAVKIGIRCRFGTSNELIYLLDLLKTEINLNCV